MSIGRAGGGAGFGCDICPAGKYSDTGASVCKRKIHLILYTAVHTQFPTLSQHDNDNDIYDMNID
jgi:gluconate kinase